MAHITQNTMMILLRWDTIFFTQFEFTMLNPSLFYTGNTCVSASATETTQLGLCFALRPFSDRWCVPEAMVSDYYFASTIWNMRLVFDGFVSDLLAAKFGSLKCCCLHGLIAGRLQYIRRGYGLQMGRYLYVEFDFQILRAHLCGIQ